MTNGPMDSGSGPQDQASATRGVVFDIQRASLHDGPGLRTTVFLKGCPLRCAWCHNPESQKLPPQTGISGKVYGQWMSVPEVMEPVLRDRHYYERSGGGLTLSGGEPTTQLDFCRALLEAAWAEGIHTCLDTSGQVSTEDLLSLLPLVDLFHYDIKHFDPKEHRKWTGVDNALIQSNLERLLERGAAIILRCPMIPGVNDNGEHERRLSGLEASGRFVGVERLPYHDTGCSKYADLGMEVPHF